MIYDTIFLPEDHLSKALLASSLAFRALATEGLVADPFPATFAAATARKFGALVLFAPIDVRLAYPTGAMLSWSDSSSGSDARVGDLAAIADGKSPVELETDIVEDDGCNPVGSETDAGKVADRCGVGRGEANPRIEGRLNLDGGAPVGVDPPPWLCGGLSKPGLNGPPSSSESSS